MKFHYVSGARFERTCFSLCVAEFPVFLKQAHNTNVIVLAISPIFKCDGNVILSNADGAVGKFSAPNVAEGIFCNSHGVYLVLI